MQFSFQGPFKETPIWIAGLKNSKKYSISILKNHKKPYLLTLGTEFLIVSKTRTFHFDQPLKKFRHFFNLEKKGFISTSASLIYHS